MAEQNITYDELRQDDKALSNMYHSLRALGENVSLDRDDILETFMTKRRYFETNIASTMSQGSDIKSLGVAEKKAYSSALDSVENLSSAFTPGGGGAPVWRALKDYAIAGVTDPTNLLSILAGAFTLGAGGAAVWGAKEAAKQGVKATLKAKINALIKNNAVKKSLAAEGSVAFFGGGASAARRQNVDIDLGRRKGYNIGEMALQATAEGILSPLAGATFNIAGTVATGLTKAGLKSTGISDSIAAQRSKDFLSKWLLPHGGLDETTARLLELNENAFKPIREKAQKVSFDIDQAIKKDFDKSSTTIDLINKAMEGDEAAIRLASERSPAMKQALDDFVKLREETYSIVRDPSIQTSDHLQNIWKKNPNYLRDIYDRYTMKAREPFNKFINRVENKNLIPSLIRAAEQYDPKLGGDNIGVKLGILTRAGQSKNMSLDQIEKIVRQELKHQYIPDLRFKSKLGALKSKDKTLDPLMKQIWGRNAKPAIRATETIMGIIEPVTDIRLASSLADNLLNRGIAIRGAARFVDPSKSPDDYVKLISKKNYGKPRKSPMFTKSPDESPLKISSKLYSEELEDIYIPKELAGKLNIMLQNQGRRTDEGANIFFNTMAATQGYLKKGKTVYSPYAHARNFLGMLQYTANSGNLRGMGDYIKAMRSIKNPEQALKFKDKMTRLGVRGSAVELNQILSRIEGAADDPRLISRLFKMLGSFGISELERTAAGKQVSKKLTDIYAGTDNVGKVMTFLSERRKAGNIWKEMDEAGKQASRLKYSKEFGADSPNILNTKQFDDELLDEMATQKALNVVPVYSRVPKILEWMRGIPVVGNFTAFPAENLRNKFKILKLGSEEIRDGFETGNKALIRTGSNRLLSQGAFAGATTGAAYVYNEVKGTDKAMDMVRESMPEWMKYHALQVRPGDDGKLYVTDLSYLNPDQYVLDMIMPLMVTAANGEDITDTLDSGLKSVLTNMYKPFLDPSLLFNFVNDMSKLITTDDPNVVNKSIKNMYKTAEPGAVKVATDLLGDAGIGPKGWRRMFDPLYYGEERGSFKDSTDKTNKYARYGLQFGALGLGLSLKEQVFDPKKQMAFTAKTLTGESRKKWRDTIQTLKNNFQDPEYSKDLPKLLADYNEALEEQYVTQQGLAKLASSYIKYYGVDKTRKLLNDKFVKQAGGLSANEIRSILQNDFMPPQIPDTFWKDLAKTNPEYGGNNISHLRREFNKVYRAYFRKSLAEEVPGYKFKVKE
jgi:hypothetical protein|tara:strand:- start:946 stop:4659 length:3714 start_codon:yes stop_codon:yes gene_type:complete